MSLHINQGGSWTPVNKLHVNQGGSWVPVKKAFVNQGGSWHEYFSASSIPSGCYGYYEFESLDENGYVLNLISGNNDGTANNCISAPAGGSGFGNCLKSADFFNEGQFRDYVNATTDTPTTAVWVDLLGINDGDFAIITMSGQYGPAYNIKAINGDLQFEAWDFMGNYYTMTIPAEELPTTWTFICVVESPVGDPNTKLTLYVNNTTYVHDLTSDLNRSNSGPSFIVFRNLRIDQLTMYSSNLSHEEILSLYNDGNGIEG